MTRTVESGSTRTFFGHPWGLATLFGIEVWERFSFYGMQAILAYYLYFSVADGGLGLPESSAASVVGAYGGLVYLATVLGAWVSDRVLGSERTVFYSGVLIMIGHVCLALVPGLAEWRSACPA
jgi:POT family proton-dependent oligopeptide transporter